MWSKAVFLRRFHRLVAGGAIVVLPCAIHAQGAAPFEVNGKVALEALISLGDAHLQKLSDVLGIVAGTADVRSGDWVRIRPRLVEASSINVPAVFWYALPDGRYWTVPEGLSARPLSDRPYFSHLLAGERVVGTLVVSRSTNRNTAIVAVPVRGKGGEIVGAIGGSVHLDTLTEMLRRELGGLDRDHIFFAVGEDGRGALNSDPALIFTEPMKLGDEEMRRAFRDMLASESGVVSYSFRGTRRTVVYRRSSITGWRYGFGVSRR
ncbi:MAG: hypothetical protein AMXMBFR55_31190 [Gemmatimonadota bacterium]